LKPALFGAPTHKLAFVCFLEGRPSEYYGGKHSLWVDVDVDKRLPFSAHANLNKNNINISERIA